MSLFSRPRHERPSIVPITPFDVEPAQSPNPELDEYLSRGRVRIEATVTRAERTVASMYESFAESAAEKTRSL